MKNKWENYCLKDGKVQSSYIREYSSLSPRKRRYLDGKIDSRTRERVESENSPRGIVAECHLPRTQPDYTGQTGSVETAVSEVKIPENPSIRGQDETIREENPVEAHQQGQQGIQEPAEGRSEAQEGDSKIQTREEEEMKHRKPAAERLYSEKAEKKMDKVYKEFGKGELHSGSKKGPVVKDVKQASAIAISEAKRAGLKAGEKWKKSERKK